MRSFQASPPCSMSPVWERESHFLWLEVSATFTKNVQIVCVHRRAGHADCYKRCKLLIQGFWFLKVQPTAMVFCAELPILLKNATSSSLQRAGPMCESRVGLVAKRCSPQCPSRHLGQNPDLCCLPSCSELDWQRSGLGIQIP